MEVDSLRVTSGVQNNTASIQRDAAVPNTETMQKTPKAVEVKTADEHNAGTNPQDENMEKYPSNEKEVTDKMISNAVESANKQLKPTTRQLEYSIHEKTNRVIVKVVDSETHEVIREVPPEGRLDVFAKILELSGLLLDKRS